MSDVASLDNCRELFEISGWDDDTQLNSYGIRIENNASPFICPAYSLGWLLRKLPDGWEMFDQYEGQEKQYVIRLINGADGSSLAIGQAIKLEDAACKLAIELFRQGILKRKG